MKRLIVSWHIAIALSGAAFAKTADPGVLENYEPISIIADLMAQSTAPAAPPATPPATTTAPTPAAPEAPKPSVLPNLSPPADEPDPNAGDDMPPPGAADEEEMGADEVPVVETTELSVDMAKRAIDVYAIVKEKYKDAEIEQYDNLQDFVDQNPRGKEFEADIKSVGFQSVNDWNLAVTTASVTYMNVIDDQSDEIKKQIEDLKTDTESSPEAKERMIKALSAMIPSENNTKIISDLVKDPAYAEKMKLLEVEEE